jgi:2-polyprenyl-6-methoxyphenol hydroxylase-like FAD-dependent oxidoreductase
MDITLVGGGLAGLTISALLARAGHKVEMLVSDDVGRSRLGQSPGPSTLPFRHRCAT